MIFTRVMTKNRLKLLNLQKSTKPLEIRDQRGAVPRNLLKQENVCLIPCEAEHPGSN